MTLPSSNETTLGRSDPRVASKMGMITFLSIQRFLLEIGFAACWMGTVSVVDSTLG